MKTEYFFCKEMKIVSYYLKRKKNNKKNCKKENQGNKSQF